MLRWLGFPLAVAVVILIGCSRPYAPPMAMAPDLGKQAVLDSVSVARFLSLPETERAERRKQADEFYGKACDVEKYMSRYMDKSRYWDWEYRIHPREIGTGITNCLHDLNEATRLDPAHVQAWCKKAELEAVVGDWGSVHRDLNNARQALQAVPLEEQAPARLRVALDHAWLCRDRGLWNEGLDWIEEAAAIDPDNQEMQLVEGLLLAGAGRFTEACRVAAALEPIEYPKIMYGMVGRSQNRSDYAARWIRGMAYLAAGDTELAYYALGPLNPHRVQIPYMNRYWNDVGLICEMGGLDKEARVYYALAYLSMPHRYYFPSFGYSCSPVIFGEPDLRTPCWVAYGQYYIAGSLFTYSSQVAAEYLSVGARQRQDALGQTALDYLNICLRRGIRPDLTRALRGRVYFAHGAYDLAEEDLMAANLAFEYQNRHDPMTSLLLGALRMGRDQYAAAIPYLRHAVEADPLLAAAWRNLGVAMIHVGKPDAGREALDRAIALQPRSPIARYNRGLLNFQEGRLEDANLDLTIASMLQPQNEDIGGLLARVQRECELAGKEPEAPGQTELAALLDTPDEPRSGQEAKASAQPDSRELDGWYRFAGPDTTSQPAGPGRKLPEYFYEDLADQPSVLSNLSPPEENLDADGFAALIPSLTAAYEADPVTENRYQLARAYVRTWQPQEALDLLLPFYPDDLTVEEMRLVIEADRALGNTERAMASIQAVMEDTPLIPDPVYWLLVAFTMLEGGYRREGFMALDVAIDLESFGVSDDYLMRPTSSKTINKAQTQRLEALESFREMHQHEIDALRSQGRLRGANELVGGKGR